MNIDQSYRQSYSKERSKYQGIANFILLGLKIVMKLFMRIVCLALFLQLLSPARTQDTFYGFSLGLSCSFGSHQNRLGFSAAAYYNYAFAQANAALRGYYNFQSLGLKQKGVELQMGAGFQLGFGRKDSARSPFVNLTENNLLQDYSLGYAYLIYLDRQKTSQTSGILSATVLDAKFATENDLFGFGQGWKDRYRTGGLHLEYRYRDYKFAINSTMWTDDYSICSKILDSEYPARFGYKTDNRNKFGGKNLGLLSARFNYLLPVWGDYFSQNLQVDVGIDAEQVRHFLQNKITHDHYPIPTKIIKRNPCHIPMDAEGGGQYLFLPGQQIERPKFYFNLGANQGMFY
ncbi:MAG: polymorphic toxin type 23 domain-containing protein [Crocinitomicaceae bacterium]